MTTHDPLLDALDAPSAEAWRPEAKGDILVGRIIGQGSYDAGYGEYDIWTFQVEQATQGGKPVKGATHLALHCLGSVLLNKTREKGLRVGGRAAIRYEGEKVSTKTKNTYKDWAVAYEPPKPGDDLKAQLPADDEMPF